MTPPTGMILFASSLFSAAVLARDIGRPLRYREL